MNQNEKKVSLAPEVIKLIEARNREVDAINYFKAITQMEIIEVAEYLNDRSIELESKIALNDMCGYNTDKMKVSVKYYNAWLRYAYNVLKLEGYIKRFTPKQEINDETEVSNDSQGGNE